jgi:hypothetical protein
MVVTVGASMIPNKSIALFVGVAISVVFPAVIRFATESAADARADQLDASQGQWPNFFVAKQID